MYVRMMMEEDVSPARTDKSLDAFDTAVTQRQDYIDRVLVDGVDQTAPQQA
jgi:hypothetical protein